MQNLSAGQSGLIQSLGQVGAAFGALNPQQQNHLISTYQLTAADLALLAASEGLTEEQREAVLTLTPYTAATAAQTTAAGGATTATGGLTAAMKGLGAVMKAHPILAFLSIAAVAIPIVIGLVDAFTTSVEEQREAFAKAKQEYEDTVSELEALGSELETVTGRVRELEAAKVAAGKLSVVEDNELTKLRAMSKELEREVQLLEREKQLKQAKADREGVKTLSKKQTHKSDLLLSLIFQRKARGLTTCRRKEKTLETHKSFKGFGGDDRTRKSQRACCSIATCDA